MASPMSFSSTCFLWLLFCSILTQGGAGEPIFEDGYVVSTVFDGDKSTIKLNPYSILPLSPSSDYRFILLDSVASSFYTVSLPTTSNETVIQKLIGNGQSSYTDGDLGSATFSKPKSFAVDYKGNVYVADHRNHAIRMITKSGVTTIAGGSSQKPGRTDGAARDASFSDDFELTFVPGRCALMISDHGNRLIRQINLKAEDCMGTSGSVLSGTTSAWIVGLAFSCLLGLIVGLVIRPYVIPYEGLKTIQFNVTWKHCLMSLERQITTLCFAIRSAVVKFKAYSLTCQLITLSLSLLSLMFKLRTVESNTNPKQPVSLLDCDIVDNDNISVSPKLYGDLNDLITFDECPMFLDTSEGLIQANLISSEDQSAVVCSAEPMECSSGLMKRRRNVVVLPSN